MKTTKYALAVALGLVALVVPREVRADDPPILFNDGGIVAGSFTVSSEGPLGLGIITSWDFTSSGGSGLGETYATSPNQAGIDLFPLCRVAPCAGGVARLFFDIPGTSFSLNFYYPFVYNAETSDGGPLYNPLLQDSVQLFTFKNPSLLGAEAYSYEDHAATSTGGSSNRYMVQGYLVSSPPNGDPTVTFTISGTPPSVAPIPEPSTLLLLGTGLLGLAGMTWRSPRIFRCSG